MIILTNIFPFCSELPLNGGCRIHGNSTEALHKASGGVSSSGGIMKQATGIRQGQGSGNRKFVNSHRQRHLAGNSNECHSQQHTLCPEVAKALSGVMLIAEQKKRLEESTKVSEAEGTAEHDNC